ncbi:hypothetical protein AM493_15715 [Flavobacterium akiainvivens]|uniref:YDG domain-containing protein n=2 Tax=Flavobacterium akiainvivens TaxID=1202724 RepID=A0A0M8MAZ3_9FLAO|nr:hypothetical protein AM493_15715 [Flavobacterium akiainvivens]
MYEFEGNATASDVVTGITASSVSVSANSIAYQNGNDGGGSSIGNASTWNTGNFSTSGKYLQYTITPSTGKQVSYSSLVFRLGRSGAGPTRVTIQISTNGFSSAGTTVISNQTISSESTGSLDSFTASTGLPSNLTGALTVRIWGHNASSTGNLRFNNFQVNGTVSSTSVAPTLGGSSTSATVTHGTATSLPFTSTGTPTPTFSLSANAPTTAVPAGITISSGAVAIANTTPAGTYNLKITATNTAGSATRNVIITVNPKTITLTNINTTKVYDGTNTASLGTPTFGGLVTGSTNVALGAYTATYNNADAATNKPVTLDAPLTLTGTHAANYTLTQPANLAGAITPKPLTLSGGTANGKIYDGSTIATLSADPTFTGLVEGDATTLSGTPQAAFASANAGTQQVIINGGYSVDNTNYTIAYPQSPAGLTAEITAAPLTVSGISAANKVYDGNTTAAISGTPQLNGLVSGDDVTVSGTPVGTFENAEIGGGKIVTVAGYTLSGAQAANYTLAPVTVFADITDPAKEDQVITFAGPATFTYGDAPYGLTGYATSNSGLAMTSYYVTEAEQAIANVVNNTLELYSAGTFTLYAYQEGDADYNGATQSVIVTVNPKTITIVNVVVDTKVYDGTDSAVATGQLDGVIAGDEVVLVTENSVFEAVNAGEEVGVVAEFILTGNNAANYVLAEDAILTTGTITPKPITASGATAANKIYDGATTATVSGGSLSGVIAPDAVTVSATGVFETPAAGNEKTVNLTYTLGGAQAGNYMLQPATGTATANITPLALTITGVTANDKVYDRNDTATLSGTATLNGLIEGDAVAPDATNATAVFNNATAATGKPVTVSGFALTGDDAANYTVSQPTGVTATISPKTITATIAGVNPAKVYNGNTTATFTGVVLDGVIAPDAVTATSGTYATRNAGEGNAITITLGGAQAANYTLTQPGLTGVITPKNITATADAVIGTAAVDPFNVNIGAGLPTSYTIRYDGIVGSDATAPGTGATFTAPTATTTATSTASAGAYPVNLSGGEATNYTFTALNSGWLVVGNPPSGETDVVYWNTDGQSDFGTTTFAPAFTHANIDNVAVQMVRGSNISGSNGTQAAANSWGGSGGWSTGNSTDNNSFTFTITVDTGNNLSLTTISTNTRRSNSGPQSYRLSYSVNGGAFAEIGTANTGSTNTTGSANSHSLSGITALQNLTGGTTIKFRMQPIGDGGNYYLNGSENAFRVKGMFGTPTQAPAITSATTDNSMLGATDEYVITATGTPQLTYSATNLPAGATYDAPNRKIVFDGTTPVGVYNITLNVSSYYSPSGDTKTLVYTVRNFTVAPSPVTGLHAYAGQAATNQPVQLQSIVGENLTNATNGNITVTASTGFRISTNNQVSYGTSGSISYSGTTINLENPNIFVKLADGLAIGEYNGTLTFTGGGITKVVNINGVVETAPSVITTAAAYGPYCAGTANGISVAFTTEGNFGAGNFYVQHSDAAGVFPTLFENIISNASTTSPIAATLPNTFAAGNYRVRVIHLSSGLVITGSTNDNGSDIVINAIPTLTGVSTSAVCTDGTAEIILSGLTANTAFTVDYTVNGGAAQQAAVTANETGNASFTLPVTFANNGQQVVVTALTRSVAPACAQTFSTNNSATLQVNPAPTAVIAGTPATVCQGGASVISLEGMIANSSANVSYTIDGNEDIVVAVTADADGKGSFTVTLPAGSHLLEIITMVRTDVTPACMGAVNASTTVVVNEAPTAVISATDAAICYGATTQVSIALTGAQPWNITYNNGTEDVVVNNVTASTYTFDVTPQANVTYTLVAVEDATCQAVPAGLTGTAAITVNQNTWTGAANNNNWNDAGNWSCGGVPTAATPATIGASAFNPQVTTTNAQALSLTVATGAVLTVKTGATLTVQNEVAANGTLTVENNAALIQVNDVANTGSATVLRNSNELFRLDYTLWGSPVHNQMLLDFSPETAPTRFYTYGLNAEGEENYLAVESPATTPFAAGTGYLIRMPNDLPDVNGYNTGDTAIPYNGIFNGVLNNGTVGVAAGELVNHYIAVANPYASPISVINFFDQNNGVLEAGEGIYFWRKKNNALETSYAHLTMAGFTENQAEGGDMGGANDGAFYYGGNDENSEDFNENWIISPGQGFVVKLRGDVSPATEIQFTNAMRKPAPAANGQPFFRTQNNNNAPAVSRWWINLTGTAAFSQALVSYMPQGTTGLDYGYDARAFADGTATLYSKAGQDNLNIQAKPVFDVTDVVPMGFSVTNAGQYTLSLDHVDGAFAQVAQNIYLKDNLTGTVHNLKQSGYSFTSGAGTFDTRFEVLYETDALGTDKPELDNAILVYRENGAINITSGAIEMTGVTLYDVRGTKIYEQGNINATEASISRLSVAQQVLIVEIETVKGTVTKRIVY